MITDDDIGKEVKVRLLNSELVRGEVIRCYPDRAVIKTEGGQVSVLWAKISTVTRVGDFTSDVDRR